MIPKNGLPAIIIILITAACKKNDTPPVSSPAPIDTPLIVQKNIDTLDKGVLQWMTINNMPGVSLAVSKNGKLVYQKGYGLGDKEMNDSVTVNSRFRIASVSKLFTSVAVMKLIQENKISIHDKVFGTGGVLGTTYGTSPYKQYVTDVTVSDLLHHTSGGWGQDNDPAFFDTAQNINEVINWTVDNIGLAKAPGTAFAYSNFNYMLLAKVIEKISGKPYEQYVTSEILNTAGAKSTSMAANTLAGRKTNEVKYYGQEDDAPYTYSMNLPRAGGAMGWLSTPADLLKFATAVDGSPTRPDILNAAAIQVMTTTIPASTGFGFHFGCGWVVEGDEWFWWGSLPGTFAILYRNGNGICIAATANSRRQPNPENALNSFIPVINFIAEDTTLPWQDIDQFK